MLSSALTKYQIKKILLIVFSIIFLLLSFTTYYNYKKLNELSKVKKAVVLAIKISAMLHNTQRERGASVGYISSDGSEFSFRLKQIRIDTDKTKNDLKNYYRNFDFTYYSHEMQNKVSIAINILNKLKVKRESIDAISITAQDAQEYYSILNSFLINSINYIAKISTNEKIRKHLYAFTNFLNLKENTGLERLVLTLAFTKNYFPEDYYEKFIDLIAKEDIYLSKFISLSTEKNIKLYKNTLVGDAVEEVKKMRKTALLNKDNILNIDSAVWFKTMTVKINLLEKIENHLSEDILNSVSTLKQKAKLTMIFNLIASLLFLFFIYFLKEDK